jgi:hypothetical protein
LSCRAFRRRRTTPARPTIQTNPTSDPTEMAMAFCFFAAASDEARSWELVSADEAVAATAEDEEEGRRLEEDREEGLEDRVKGLEDPEEEGEFQLTVVVLEGSTAYQVSSVVTALGLLTMAFARTVGGLASTP